MIRRSTPLLLAIAVLVALPAAAQSGGSYRGPGAPRNILRFELGLFTPRGAGDYFPDKELEFSGTADDFEDLSVGFDYLRLLNERLGALVSTTYWEGSARQSYLDFTDLAGAPIRHTTDFSIFSAKRCSNPL